MKQPPDFQNALSDHLFNEDHVPDSPDVTPMSPEEIQGQINYLTPRLDDAIEDIEDILMRMGSAKTGSPRAYMSLYMNIKKQLMEIMTP